MKSHARGAALNFGNNRQRAVPQGLNELVRAGGQTAQHVTSRWPWGFGVTFGRRDIGTSAEVLALAT